MKQRVLSGMRPTGALHLGHLCGVLASWQKLQENYDCYFFVADWHALTTDYAAPADYPAAAREMVLTWLAAGIDGKHVTIFIQSQIPEHAELHVLLSMFCQLPKLMQLPTYKEQKENINRDIDTYGFLGYPLLQSADILAYRPEQIPVGEDQLPHIEFTREIARRFNHLYGSGDAFHKKMKQKIRQLPPETRAVIESSYRRYRQDGDSETLNTAFAAIEALALPAKERAQLRGYCAYDADEILPLPEAYLTPAAKLPGTDGRKMSKSYANTIELFESSDSIAHKIARMQTDPARQRRQDKGNPDNCAVWSLHGQFSDDATRRWADAGCRSAGIGCVDCKKRLTDGINTALTPLRERRRDIEKSGIVDDVIASGNRHARTVAAATLNEVRRAMRLISPA